MRRYVVLIMELGSVSVRLSEYRVLVMHAVEQVGMEHGSRIQRKTMNNKENHEKAT